MKKNKLFQYQTKNQDIWGLGIGDWGLGIGDWGLGPTHNPQSPIPNPQSPIPMILIIIKIRKRFHFKLNSLNKHKS